MRKHLHIDLARRTTGASELCGEDLARLGRHLIAKELTAAGAAMIDPLSPANPLIFATGPFAGTTMSNANRLSVGCRSPLTGGIKEANTGGTLAVALGQIGIAAITFHGAAEDWVVILLTRDGGVAIEDAAPFVGQGVDATASQLLDRFGPKVSIAVCGPVGEYQGLLAGIAFTDREGRPSRLAARGGIGAVMGAKRIKAVVAEFDSLPPMHDRKKFHATARDYATRLGEQAPVQSFRRVGTAGMADYLNYVGGLPVRNFSGGQLVDPKDGPLKVGGEFLRETMLERGGDPEHGCMAGCVIKCSNVYVDADGKELVSPLEYETLGLLGTNCGIGDPDVIAQFNATANDLGVDTIELGATIGVLMEAGQAEFGDAKFVFGVLDDLRLGTERGRLFAQGTARVAEHFGVRRVPVIKKQAISAYDPRVVEVTAISMMTTAQGADHTAGNMPMFDSAGKSVRELVAASLAAQTSSAVADSFGLCLFGRTATDISRDLLAQAVNNLHGTAIDAAFLEEVGRDTLRLEWEFNRMAGFTPEDDRLPDFFLTESLPPTGKVSRLDGAEISKILQELLQVGTEKAG